MDVCVVRLFCLVTLCKSARFLADTQQNVPEEQAVSPQTQRTSKRYARVSLSHDMQKRKCQPERDANNFRHVLILLAGLQFRRWHPQSRSSECTPTE